MDELDRALRRREQAKSAYDDASENLYEVLRAMVRAPGRQQGFKTELAKRAGITPQHLRRIELGETWRKTPNTESG